MRDGRRQLVLIVVTVVAAVVLGSGLAVAATLEGTAGDDTINGTSNADKIYGKGGADTISGMDGSDIIEGGNGADELYGVDENRTNKPGNDVIRGDHGRDMIVGGPGKDELYGGGHDDAIYAGSLDEASMDTVSGDDGDDTIYAANFPASKDIVKCGTGIDEVTADSLDEVGGGCEEVERIREEEPNLADGSYQLKPDTSSECDLGQGTVTIGNDPETGEHGALVEFGRTEAPEGTGVLACEIKIDYQEVSSTQGEVSTQSGDTLSYEGTEPSQPEIDEALEEPQGAETIGEQEDTPPPSEEVGAQYAWNANKFTQVMTTRDPAFIRLNQTRIQLGWWHNGSSVSFRYRNGSCYANPNTGLSTWHTSQCFFVGAPYYGRSGSVGFVGTQVKGAYYNYDFLNPNVATVAIHRNYVEGYGRGGAARYPSFFFAGEAYHLLRGYSYGYYGNYVGPG